MSRVSGRRPRAWWVNTNRSIAPRLTESIDRTNSGSSLRARAILYNTILYNTTQYNTIRVRVMVIFIFECMQRRARCVTSEPPREVDGLPWWTPIQVLASAYRRALSPVMDMRRGPRNKSPKYHRVRLRTRHLQRGSTTHSDTETDMPSGGGGGGRGCLIARRQKHANQMHFYYNDVR